MGNRRRLQSGSPAKLEENLYRYRRGLTGNASEPPGRPSKLHRVNGQMVTMRQAADEIGCTAHALRSQMRDHHISLEEAVRRVEALNRKRAAKQIMEILEGKT